MHSTSITKQKKTVSICIFFIFLLTASACKKPVITQPGARETEKEKWTDLISKGDREFGKMYWSGWHNAIPLYENALKIKRDNSLGQKLFFAYLLLAMREKEFQVRNEEVLKKAEKLMNETESHHQGIYLDIATRTVMAPGLWENFQSQKFPEISREQVKNNIETLKSNSHSDYLYYFYLDYLGRYGGNQELKVSIQERDRFLKEFPDSNLRISLGDCQFQVEETLSQYPDFLELIMILADQYYQAGKYAQAKSRYRSVLKINPRMPAAFTGIGSIYFWLELYGEAEKNYDQALAITPNFSRALFGKAMCKHYLNQFEQSNEILTRLLENQPLYHGESYYYRALNHFNLKNNSKVEDNIEKAMTFIPDSIELNAFAGLFYYYSKSPEKAKIHLQKVISRRIHHPDAFFYMGLIALTEKKPASQYFISSARYYWEDLKNQKTKLGLVNNLELEENLKKKLRFKRLHKLEESAKDSLEKIKKVLTVYEGVKTTCSRVREFYQKIQKLTENPANIDSTRRPR